MRKTKINFQKTLPPKKSKEIPGKLRIGVDLDGVVVDIYFTLRRQIIDQYGIDIYEGGGPTYYRLSEHPKLKPIPGYKEFIDSLINNPLLYQESPQIDYAVPCLNWLYDRGHDIWFVTSRREEFKEATLRWFKTNNLPWAPDKLIMCWAEIDKRPASKNEVCQKIGLHVFIEDHAPTIKEASSKNMMLKILLKQKWNMAENPGNAVVCDNWREILEKIQGVILEEPWTGTKS